MSIRKRGRPSGVEKSRTAFRIILCILNEIRMLPNIAEALKIKKPGVIFHLNRLLKAGYVERWGEKGDVCQLYAINTDEIERYIIDAISKERGKYFVNPIIRKFIWKGLENLADLMMRDIELIDFSLETFSKAFATSLMITGKIKHLLDLHDFIDSIAQRGEGGSTFFHTSPYNNHTKLIQEKSIQISIRPLTIIIPQEQEEVYGKVKTALEKAMQIMNDDSIEIQYRLEAMRLVGYLGQVLSGVLRTVKLDEIQEQLLELEEKVKSSRSRAGGGKRGAPIYSK